MPRAEIRAGYRRYWFYFSGFIFFLSLGKRIPASVRRTCSHHSPEQFLMLSEEAGSYVKDTLSAEFLSVDRSKLEGMFKEVGAMRAQGTTAR